MTRTRLITVLGSLTVVILAVASWLLVLSPRVAEAAEIQSQSESVHEQASGVQRDIVKLQAMKDKLPDRMARFDRAQGQLPAVPRRSRLSWTRSGMRQHSPACPCWS